MVDFGEIFHDDRAMTSFAFLDFLERWPDPLSTILDYEACRQIASAYLRQLPFESQGRRVLIDIKHNAWGILRPLWQYPHDEPLFMTALKGLRSTFIHLRRQNLADQIISYYLSINPHVWHDALSWDRIPSQIRGQRLDPVLARKLCIFFESAEALTESFLVGYPRRIHLTYETTFDNGVLSQDAATKLSNELGVPTRVAALSSRQNLIDKREVVSNYDEIYAIAEEVRGDHSRGLVMHRRG
jgi:hypothetical protein